MATLSALVGAGLAPVPEVATLPVASGVIGIAAATMPTARFSRQFGRRPVFIAAALWGACGATLAGYAIQIDSFGLFCAACFAMGNNMASVAQYRFCRHRAGAERGRQPCRRAADGRDIARRGADSDVYRPDPFPVVGRVRRQTTACCRCFISVRRC